jgi:hypothetical protein
MSTLYLGRIIVNLIRDGISQSRMMTSIIGLCFTTGLLWESSETVASQALSDSERGSGRGAASGCA